MKKTLSTIWYIIDVGIWMLSPFAVIMFVFALVAGIGNYGEHAAQMRAFTEEGELIPGTIDSIDFEDGYIWVRYDPPYNGNDLALTRLRYYDEDWVRSLTRNQPVTARAMPPQGNEMVIEDAWDQYADFLGRSGGLIVVLIVSAVWVAYHPEMLYLGYVDAEQDDDFLFFPAGRPPNTEETS